MYWCVPGTSNEKTDAYSRPTTGIDQPNTGRVPDPVSRPDGATIPFRIAIATVRDRSELVRSAALTTTATTSRPARPVDQTAVRTDRFIHHNLDWVGKYLLK